MQSGGYRSLVALAVLVALAMVAACRPATETDSVDNQPVSEPAGPALPVADPPLDRARLLQAVAQAASGAALGSTDSRPDQELDGERFELRIRFGCPADPIPGREDRFSVRFDEKNRTLRLRAAQDLTAADPDLAALAGGQVEAVEGFWLRRPWLLSAGCPVDAASPAETARAPRQGDGSGTGDMLAAPHQPTPPRARQRIGIAQFFTAVDARTGRRGDRAYEATKTLAVSEAPSPQGYDLVLSGRLTRLPNGQVIACRVLDRDGPPDCVISTHIDRVRFEHPISGAVIAEWSS